MANLFRVASSAIREYAFDSVAQEYKEGTRYEKGDYVLHDGLLYSANEGMLSGVFDPSKWTRTYLSEISDLTSEIEPSVVGTFVKSTQYSSWGPNHSTSSFNETHDVTCNIAAAMPYYFKKLTAANFVINCGIPGGHDNPGAFCGNLDDANHQNFGVTNMMPGGGSYDARNGTLTKTIKKGLNAANCYIFPKGWTDISGQV